MSLTFLYRDDLREFRSIWISISRCEGDELPFYTFLFCTGRETEKLSQLNAYPILYTSRALISFKKLTEFIELYILRHIEFAYMIT